MDEVLFMGMNLPKEVDKFLNEKELLITNGMSGAELKSYRLGVKNALSALSSIINGFDDYVLVHTANERYTCELDIRDLRKMVNNN